MTRHRTRHLAPVQFPAWLWAPVAAPLLVALLVAAGRMFWAHDLQVHALATAAGLVTAVWEAWALLIEIRR